MEFVQSVALAIAIMDTLSALMASIVHQFVVEGVVKVDDVLDLKLVLVVLGNYTNGNL